MTNWSPQRFLETGKQRLASPLVLEAALQSAKLIKSRNKNVPVIFTLGHISAHTKVPYHFLREVITRENLKYYKVFKLQKRNAGFTKKQVRFICAPHPYLLRVQRWINERILKHIPIDDSSYAYRANTSIADAAFQHCECRWLIKLDLSNFFESILEPKVYKVFRELGYNRLLSLELARLCTRTRNYGNPSISREKISQKKLPYIKNKYIGHVPQGAATSPLLANIISRDLDVSLKQFSKNLGLVYTRYADDLIFSTKTDLTRAQLNQHINELYKIIKSHGYWPNFTKTKISPPGARKIVLGLLVNGVTPRLPKEFKAEIKTHIHFISRSDIGVAQHMANRGFESAEGFRNFLYGKLSFANHIEPDWAARRKCELDRVDWAGL
ncbi:reverse transcriptase family protein [Pseudomonas corrugata]|uniref:reverse transcriptase family protein n=1 Tax=Pseudomonas corrugata TaxID=47879 RepID=UPI0009C07C01|nr:reverse transcriptase family protein [Pseudomonas corrugata]